MRLRALIVPRLEHRAYVLDVAVVEVSCRFATDIGDTVVLHEAEDPRTDYHVLAAVWRSGPICGWLEEAIPDQRLGAGFQSDDGGPFDAIMKRLVAELQAQNVEGARLDARIAETLEMWGLGGCK